MKILELDRWNIPTSSYPLATRGTASISRYKLSRGFYRMEGILGYQIFECRKPIPVTELIIQGDTWMVDDPLHWHGMKYYIQSAPPGHLICAGLGLGLMLWHAKEETKFTKITVVERNPDVIELISPLVPQDDRVEIVQSDFYDFRSPVLPDCILWDLAVGQSETTIPQFVRGASYIEQVYPGCPVMYFGFRDSRTLSPFMSDYGAKQ